MTVPVPFGESIKSPFEFVVEMVFVSTVMLSTTREVPTIVVKVPAAALLPPITAPSTVPPSMSGVLISGDVRVLFVSVSVVFAPIRVVVLVGRVTTTFPE